MKQRKREKYLSTRAITSPWQLQGCQGTEFRAAIVIPALAESVSLPQTLESLLPNSRELLSQTLVVVVVNNRKNSSISEKTDNLHTLVRLAQNSYPGLNLGWVDAASCGLELPDNQGVGLARKIGFDLALPLLNWAAEPLLISLDADTLVDGHYLRAIFSHFATTSAAGAYLPFRHQTAEYPEQEAAIRSYELYLRSYQFGLSRAGSPYAFIAIGSALACRAAAYIRVGGMKRRQAGEDFYFLQQLVKCGGVSALPGTVVRPSSRFSQRVPFGTGCAVQATAEDGVSLYRFIDRDAFLVLRSLILLIAKGGAVPGEDLLQHAGVLSPLLHSFLEELNFVENWQKLRQNHPAPQLLDAWHDWFDALRTRQLLQRLSAGHPSYESTQLIAELLTEAGYPTMTDRSQQLHLLESLQGVTANC